MRLWLRLFLYLCKPTPSTRRHVVIIRFCACDDIRSTPSTRWLVLCVYMSAAKHFGFVRSCLAAVLGYFFILLGNIYRLSLV